MVSKIGRQSLEQMYPVGCRVLIKGDHPQANKTGIVNRYEVATLVQRKGAIVYLDDGLDCFVFYAANMEKLT